MQRTAVFEALKFDVVTSAGLVDGILVPAYSTSVFLYHQSDKTTEMVKCSVTSYMASLAISFSAFEK